MSCVLYILFCVAAALIVVKLWIKLTTRWCRSNVSLVGKTALVTGANTGLGYHTAADFAKRGARVILACRDQTRGEEAQRKLIEETDNPNIYYKHLDLGSLKSVREFAVDINKSEKRLDILVNNAGIYAGQSKTEDGLVLVMQINHFGPFLLTNLLLDLLKETPNSRIVNVASLAAKYCPPLDMENLNKSTPEDYLNEMTIYGQTKLCNVLFTIELEKKLKNTGVTVYSVHPGVIHTEILKRRDLRAIIWKKVVELFFKNPLEGAQTTIYCSVQKGIESLSGQQFHNCHYAERYKSAQDSHLSSNLWEISEKLVNLNK